MMKRIITFCFCLVLAASVFGKRYIMCAWGHDPIELYKWVPEFSREDHCIYTEFFFQKVYGDEKEEMEKAGFHTDASFDAGRWNFDWNILRIDPYNVAYMKCISEADCHTIYLYTTQKIMELCGL